MIEGAFRPRLRWPLDIQRDEFEGRKILLLSCPLGITPEPLALIAEVGPILARLDGSISFSELKELFEQHGVAPEVLEQLISLLDERLFLETDKFTVAAETMRSNYAKLTLREAALAGRSYPADKDLLGQEIDSYLITGPGATQLETGNKLQCLMSPHIDYHRGGACYGVTYQHLRGCDQTTYLVIGTSHQWSQRMFQLTAKDFHTPLGTLTCDREFVQRLSASHGLGRSFEDEYLHKKEHSLELQLPFLQRIGVNGKIVPILVGSFFEALESGRLPNELEEYESFAASLAETIRWADSHGERVMIVAGVDMAHIGRYFGDQVSLSEELLENVSHRDKEYLAALESLKKEALYAHIASDGDKRRICGFPTMYLILDLFERLGWKPTPRVFHYQQAINYANDCAVTFAGMGFYHPSSPTGA